MTAAQFFHYHAIDGRAVITCREVADDLGHPEPALWLCRLNNTLVLCDDVGPDHYWQTDEGCLKSVNPKLSLEEVVALYRGHRRRILNNRRVRRKTAAHASHLTAPFDPEPAQAVQ